MIAIIDYGLGNIASVSNILRSIGIKDHIIVNKPEDLDNANKLILPGVGAFDTGMSFLNQTGMKEEIDRQVINKGKPILGICLGMQMLGRRSDEGKLQGLGYIPFVCRKFELDRYNLRVPHMGWDYVNIKRETKLVLNHSENPRFYFVHSYYAICEDDRDILMTCDYGIEFAVGINRDNIYGVQFHPEKSHRYGKWLIKNFCEEV